MLLPVFRQLSRSRHILTRLHEPIRESSQLSLSVPDIIKAMKDHGLDGAVATRLTIGMNPANADADQSRPGIYDWQLYAYAGPGWARQY